MNKHFSLLYYLDNADRQNSSAWDFCFLSVFALWDTQETMGHVFSDYTISNEGKDINQDVSNKL